jgi:hypothetical protein
VLSVAGPSPQRAGGEGEGEGGCGGGGGGVGGGGEGGEGGGGDGGGGGGLGGGGGGDGGGGGFGASAGVGGGDGDGESIGGEDGVHRDGLCARLMAMGCELRTLVVGLNWMDVVSSLSVFCDDQVTFMPWAMIISCSVPSAETGNWPPASRSFSLKSRYGNTKPLMEARI